MHSVVLFSSVARGLPVLLDSRLLLLPSLTFILRLISLDVAGMMYSRSFVHSFIQPGAGGAPPPGAPLPARPRAAARLRGRGPGLQRHPHHQGDYSRNPKP